MLETELVSPVHRIEGLVMKAFNTVDDLIGELHQRGLVREESV